MSESIIDEKRQRAEPREKEKRSLTESVKPRAQREGEKERTRRTQAERIN